MGLRSEFGLLESMMLRYQKFDGVPVKTQKAIRVPREKCLALSAFDERHGAKVSWVVDRSNKGDHRVRTDDVVGNLSSLTQEIE